MDEIEFDAAELDWWEEAERLFGGAGRASLLVFARYVRVGDPLTPEVAKHLADVLDQADAVEEVFVDDQMD